MKKFFVLFAVIAVLSSFKTDAILLHPELKPEDSTLFDFWLGNWEASWSENGQVKVLGENHLTKEFSNRVIRERFKINDGASKGFEGGSWTVYDKNKQKWFQTWVDNSGAYMAFEGRLDGNNRIFERQAINKKGQHVWQRMVFKNIKPDSFTWDWESSPDEGKTWALNWRIFYRKNV